MKQEEVLEQWFSKFIDSSPEERQKLLTEDLPDEDILKEGAHLAQQLDISFSQKQRLDYVHTLRTIANENATLEPTPEQIDHFEKVMSPAGGWWKWAIAAIAAVSVIATLWWFSLQPPAAPTLQQIQAYHQIALPYLQPFENTLFLLENQSDPLWNGMQAYEAGDYTLAYKELQQAWNQQPDAPIQFYLGVSQLLAGQAEQAIASLQDEDLLNDDAIGEDAGWYLGLSYLEAGKIEEARQILHELKDSQGYQEQAQAILNKLETLD